jgi:hypothetical protein
MMIFRAKRHLLIACGTVCIALGVFGVFLPVLPTTPFLLLAAVCYARGSRRFYDRLIANRWCGEYIRNYREGRGIPAAQKALMIVLLWLTIGSTACFAVSLWWVRLLLIAIAAGVTVHLLLIKTCHTRKQFRDAACVAAIALLAAASVSVCPCEAGERSSGHAAHAPARRPSYKEFAASHRFPYRGSAEKIERLKRGYARLSTGLGASDIAAVLGAPDYVEDVYPKVPSHGPFAVSWTYVCEMRDPRGANVKTDRFVRVFFTPRKKTFWIVADLEGCPEIGSPAQHGDQ